MRTGKDVNTFVEEAFRIAKTKRDFVAPMKNMWFNNQNELVIGDKGFYSPNNLFDQQISTYLKYPMDFYTRTRSEFNPEWRNLINKMLETSTATRMIRTLDGKARAFLSDRYKIIDNWDIIEIASANIDLKGGWRVESADITDTRMYLKVVSPLTKNVAVGEPVQAGFVIENSEVGLGKWAVYPMIYTLRCKNGQIQEEMGVAQRHLGKSNFIQDDGVYELLADDTKSAIQDTLLKILRDVISITIDEARFALVLKKYQETLARKIEAEPEKVVEVVAKQARFSETTKNSVLEKLTGWRKKDDNKYNQYYLIDSITEAAQSPLISYDEATRLEKIGGHMINMNLNEWNVIATGDIKSKIKPTYIPNDTKMLVEAVTA